MKNFFSAVIDSTRTSQGWCDRNFIYKKLLYNGRMNINLRRKADECENELKL